MAKTLLIRNAPNTVFSVKRMIWRQFNDPILQADPQDWPFRVVEGNDKNQ